MARLEEIFQSPLDFDGDKTVTLSYDEHGHQSGFKFGFYNSNHGWVWRDEHVGMSTPDINAMLVEEGYVPVVKQTEKQPFDFYWNFRPKSPSWTTFRGWLSIWYAEMEAQIQESELATTYIAIMCQLHDERPELEEAIAWTLAQEVAHPQETAYSELKAILIAYSEMMAS